MFGVGGVLRSLLYLDIIDWESVKIVTLLNLGQVLIADRIAVNSALYEESQSLISAE